MAAAEPIGLAGLETLSLDARVILTDNLGELEALASLTPLNPRVCFAVATVDANLSPLAGREVVVWVSRPSQGYWLAQSAQAWLKRLAAIASPVHVVVDDDSIGPARWQGEALGQWLTARLRPVSDVLPSNVTPIRPEPVARRQRSEVYLTEDSLLAAFTAAHPNLRYVALWGQWLIWTGSKWRPERTNLVLDLAYQVCLAESDRALADGASPAQYARTRTERARSAVEKLARSSRDHASDPDEWDANLWSLCTPGGIVDLRTGELREATAADLVIKQTRNTPRGECPRWLQFLDEATAGDKELQRYLQRIAGYALTGSTTEQCFFFAYGPGGNGKGTYINTLTHILGDYAMVSNMDVFMESKGDRHLTEIAGLRGARMVQAQETEEGRRWAESKLKTMTGSDPLRARFMRQDEFTFMPQFKLILSGNNKPALRSLDDAMRRRMNLIPFTVKFDGARRDNDLMAKLMAEGDGIMAWAVQGCVDWLHDGLRTPAAVRQATSDYFDDQDIVKHWINECCEIQAQARGPSQKLYDSFRGWAKDNGESYIMPLRKFRQRLIDLGHTDRRLREGVHFEGIKLADSMTMTRGHQQDDIPGFD